MQSKSFKFPLGEETKSTITNLVGKIIASTEHLNGCDRYLVQPMMGEDEKIPDAYYMDEGELSLLPRKKGTLSGGMTEFDFLIGLGIEVMSNVTGFKGVVVSRGAWLNSVNKYYIQPKVDKDGKIPDGSWIVEGEILVMPTAKKPIKKKNPDRGGFISTVK